MSREIFSTFYIEKAEFDYKNLSCFLTYSFDKKVRFTEEIMYTTENFTPRKDINKDFIENILFHILIAFGISYYKLNPTQKIIVEYGSLDENAKSFWRKFYINGLGEFFYKNNIDFTELCFFESTSNKKFEQVNFTPNEKYLVPIGGGKDSIVTTILLEEDLKNSGNTKNQAVGMPYFRSDITPFIFGKSDKIKDDFLKIYGKEALLTKRKLSPKLFELNDTGYLNGHVPITGLISFALLLTAYLYDYKYIVFSNERSANIGNTEFYGNLINHQYSKSEEFEHNFQDYVNRYISPNIAYYSALRNYSELEIAHIFCEKGKKYFATFSSCNSNFKINPTKENTEKLQPDEWKDSKRVQLAGKSENSSEPYLRTESEFFNFGKSNVPFSDFPKNISQNRWCNKCPKCLFVYTIMRPFLTKEEVTKIWGQELFTQANLRELYLEIIGAKGFKPFECVGEVEEAQLASQLSISKFKEIPILLQEFQKEFPNLDIQAITKKYLQNK